MKNKLRSLRETYAIVIIWLIFSGWVVGGSFLFGYPKETAEISIVFGMPSWVAWCIGLPWVVANVVTIWFALFYMQDEAAEGGEDE